MIPAEVIKQTVEIGRELSSRLLETEHELVVLWSLLLTIVLLVGAMVFEDLVGILRYANFFRGELIVKRIAEVVGCDLELFNLGKCLGWGSFHLNEKFAALARTNDG